MLDILKLASLMAFYGSSPVLGGEKEIGLSWMDATKRNIALFITRRNL